MAPTVPYRQIRARHTSITVILYQEWYSAGMAAASCAHQELDAPIKFIISRMTWIKSWAWMLHRNAYSYEDSEQERILAPRLNKGVSLDLLRNSVVASSHTNTIGLEQEIIGTPGGLIQDLTEGTVNIEDVTQRARLLKQKSDEDADVGHAQLLALDLAPEENAQEIDDEPQTIPHTCMRDLRDSVRGLGNEHASWDCLARAGQ
ncbi:hypothetical protein T440DRAFT_553716 [Plenodomus tracheiphilus IPT5]|uniref:Uncharacterized protein n=1 Tax=Plenodomus tracheiphilus IPT5 TaxID=1408161 RepID=A0A6A7B9X5_9PLEO|nr:hypothetical protein T440DRAFT_553716 [Plenodomus tracheiphilus IPT5]